MLKNTRKENEVVTLKLTTGEEIIGYYVSHDENNVVVRKPVTLVATGQGSGVALAPFLMTSDYMKSNEHLEFPKNGITTMATTNKQFTDAYIQQVSGLDMSTTAKPGLITG